MKTGCRRFSQLRGAIMPTLREPFAPFVDRRTYDPGVGRPAQERRQFANSHDDLSPEARELAVAIDEYKLVHRRRFITYEEMLSVVKGLGYSK
jgi:hypothetical protein